jgi:hypothetical protein
MNKNQTGPARGAFVEHVDFSDVEPVSKTIWPGVRYDYVSPGLKRPDLSAAFPDLVARDPAPLQWPYLRKDAPHIWRSDARSWRNPDIGVLSVDEAAVLYNNAIAMRGARGLEIGCHYGWSTAHLAAAGLNLDVIDPALGYPDQARDVADSLARAGGPGHAKLWAGFSPSIVPAVRSTQGAPWSFAFIDGFHEGRAPLDDAEAVSGLMAENAAVMFHDLISPHVAAGLAHFQANGWNVGLYNTMQIMGIAWRGAARPAEHIADVNMPPIAAEHLLGFAVLSSPG